jgi:hypothetical protein
MKHHAFGALKGFISGTVIALLSAGLVALSARA